VKPLRVAGCDPGTGSLDVLVLEDGAVRSQHRFAPADLHADPTLPARWLAGQGPLDLVAGPSGYGLPLVHSAHCTDRDLALMSLVRPEERGTAGGVAGFSAVVRALRDSALPVVFLPGVIHLATVPRYRKVNRVDLGTPDKLCVAALALQQYGTRRGWEYGDVDLCVVELGSAFTACLLLRGGVVVEGLGGTSGPFGWQSGGAWDGELAYLLGPLAKRDLFAGGAAACDRTEGQALFRESLVRAVAGLRAVQPFEEVALSGRLLETEPALADGVAGDLAKFGTVARLGSLPGAWVKHAAQGAALLADGLAGGRYAELADHLGLRGAHGTVLDWLRHPRADEVRAAFGV
jgi:predicted butyrate kinase (DUF1464 family)